MKYLDELFDKCLNAKEFIRIGTEYKNEIYVGYNSFLQKTLVVRGISKLRKSKSSNRIGVEIRSEKNEHVTLSFSLLDGQFSDVFYKFCEDIIVNSINFSQKDIVLHTIKRWDSWRKMFERHQNEVISKMQVQGLIGELLFLKYYLIKKVGAESAINAWVGAESNPKDFCTENTWYEIKTISESSFSVTVSSLEQLESKENGYLVVVKVQKTSCESERCISLNKLVLDTIKDIQDPYVMELFHVKLAKYGYSYNSFYDEDCYLYSKTIFYLVDESFPILRRDSIPTEIIKVSYELFLKAIKDEETEVWI